MNSERIGALKSSEWNFTAVMCVSCLHSL